jgi:histidine phosphotransferase ChpT
MGGTAVVRVVEADGRAAITLDATGPRARLKPEVLRGLKGEGRGDAVGGAWVQAYYLSLIVKSAGGQLAAEVGEDRVTLAAWAPV